MIGHSADVSGEHEFDSPHEVQQFSLRFVVGSCFVQAYYQPVSLLTKKYRKQLNIFERKVCRRILGPVYDNEKENWRILTDKETYGIVKKNLP
jgi:hypothetical protein